MEERFEALLAEVQADSSVVEPDWEPEDDTSGEGQGRDAERGGCGQATTCPTCGGRATVESCRVVRCESVFGIPFEIQLMRYTVRCWRPWTLVHGECPTQVEEAPLTGPQPEFPPPPRPVGRSRYAPRVRIVKAPERSAA